MPNQDIDKELECLIGACFHSGDCSFWNTLTEAKKQSKDKDEQDQIHLRIRLEKLKTLIHSSNKKAEERGITSGELSMIANILLEFPLSKNPTFGDVVGFLRKKNKAIKDRLAFLKGEKEKV